MKEGWGAASPHAACGLVVVAFVSNVEGTCPGPSVDTAVKVPGPPVKNGGRAQVGVVILVPFCGDTG